MLDVEKFISDIEKTLNKSKTYSGGVNITNVSVDKGYLYFDLFCDSRSRSIVFDLEGSVSVTYDEVIHNLLVSTKGIVGLQPIITKIDKMCEEGYIFRADMRVKYSRGLGHYYLDWVSFNIELGI